MCLVGLLDFVVVVKVCPSVAFLHDQTVFDEMVGNCWARFSHGREMMMTHFAHCSRYAKTKRSTVGGGVAV